MSDTKENVGNGADKSDGTPKVSDTEFMMVCFKNIQGSVSIDVAAVAETLKYKNPVSVSNRIGLLRKKYGLEVSCVATRAPGTGSAQSTPRKGAKASAGPIKAKPPPKEGEEVEKPKRGRKPAAKDGEAGDKPKRTRKPAAKRGPKAEAAETEPELKIEDNVKPEADSEEASEEE